MKYYHFSFIGTDKKEGGTVRYTGSGWIAWDGYPPIQVMLNAVSTLGNIPTAYCLVTSFREMPPEEFLGVFGVPIVKHGDAQVSFLSQGEALEVDHPQPTHDIPQPTPIKPPRGRMSDLWESFLRDWGRW